MSKTLEQILKEDQSAKEGLEEFLNKMKEKEETPEAREAFEAYHFGSTMEPHNMQNNDPEPKDWSEEIDEAMDDETNGGPVVYVGLASEEEDEYE